MELKNLQDFEALPVTITFVRATKRDAWECDQWAVVIGDNPATKFEASYYTGTGLRKAPKGKKNPFKPRSLDYEQWNKENLKPVKPDIAGVMYALLSDATASDYNFNDWAAEYGLSSDSLKAFHTYQHCLEIAASLNNVFKRDERAKMQELLADY